MALPRANLHILAALTRPDDWAEGAPGGENGARAGLRPGDVVLSVREEKPKSADEFRKLVRKNALPFKVTTFAIMRQSERHELLVHLDL